MEQRNSTLVRILCALLALLLAASVCLLPVVEFRDLTELYAQILERSELEIGAKYVRQIQTERIPDILLRLFSRVKLDDFGDMTNGYGFESGKLQRRMEKIDEEVREQLEEAMASASDEDEFGKELLTLLRKESFREDLAEGIFATLLITIYKNGWGDQLDVAQTMRTLQTLAACCATRQFSLLDAARIVGALDTLADNLRRVDELELPDELQDLSGEMSTALKAAKYGLYGVMGFFGLFALLVLLGCALNKKGLALGFGIPLTLVTLLWAAFWKFGYSMALKEIDSEFPLEEIVRVSVWPLVAAAAGLLLCILAIAFWRRNRAAAKAKPAQRRPVPVPPVQQRPATPAPVQPAPVMPAAPAQPAPPEGWVCPGCGNAVKGSSKFCPECGTKRPEPPAVEMPKKYFCAACGAEMDEGDVFCTNCGTKRAT